MRSAELRELSRLEGGEESGPVAARELREDLGKAGVEVTRALDALSGGEGLRCSRDVDWERIKIVRAKDKRNWAMNVIRIVGKASVVVGGLAVLLASRGG
ncbi:hypothetical protein TrRE_jg1799 [Triparma retinervis]|uniref:Uncharacterized protein n=1 Tax=Triparma retinervis TaxID=2557542 RepID=A0A9W7G2G6_9STRA|nr:hypothetical protein TrRE_jg1799 [Triparma retinervis]